MTMSSLVERALSLAVKRRVYVPAAEKVAVVARARGLAKVTVPIPDTTDQVVVRVAGGGGRPSSVAVPDKLAVAGKVMV
jgi:hypothetical protein